MFYHVYTIKSLVQTKKMIYLTPEIPMTYPTLSLPSLYSFENWKYSYKHI